MGELACAGVWELLTYWGRYPPPHLVLRDLAGILGGLQYGAPAATEGRFRESSKDDILQFAAAVKRS